MGNVRVVSPSASDGVPSSVTPDFEEDFSTYTSTSNLVSDPRGVFGGDFCSNGCANSGTGQIVLDTSEAYTGLSQAMRYDIPSAGCDTGTPVRRVIQWDTPQKEIWIELAVRFASNFNVNGPGGCSTADSYKWLFLSGDGDAWARRYQWVFHGANSYENGHGGSQSWYNGSLPYGSFWDGAWHIHRFHLLNDTTTGIYRWSVDGTVQHNATNIDTRGSMVEFGLGFMALGANFNNGPDAATTLHYGRVRVWYGTTNNDPGWTDWD